MFSNAVIPECLNRESMLLRIPAFARMTNLLERLNSLYSNLCETLLSATCQLTIVFFMLLVFLISGHTQDLADEEEGFTLPVFQGRAELFEPSADLVISPHTIVLDGQVLAFGTRNTIPACLQKSRHM